MKHHLDTKQLRSLRQLYTSTQCDKEAAIEKKIYYWGPDAVERLDLDKYSNMSLRSLVKVAQRAAGSNSFASSPIK